MISDVVKLTGKLLEDKQNWSYDAGRYCLVYKDDENMRIWTANGFFFLSLYSYNKPEYTFNFYEKCYIWFKIRKVCAHLREEYKKQLNLKKRDLAIEIMKNYE